MKRFFLALLCCFSLTFMVAQPPQTAITVQSAGHEHFWLYLNNALQNERSDEVVIVKNLAPSNYDVTIVMDNRQETTLNTRIQLHTGVNYFEVACPPGNNNISFRSSDKDVEMAGQAVNAFGNMVGQMNVMYEADVHHMNNGPQHGHGHGHGAHHAQPQAPAPPHSPHQSPAAHQPPHQTPPPPPTPMPCNDNDFREIKDLIRSETFEDSKLTVAKQATLSELLTVDQLAEIAALFTFEDTKLEYLKFAYDFCFDRNKYYKLNNVFTYSSSIDELNEYIRGR
ncbi:MAG: DUF4476 domain-containing protein [Bacteroidales bacterium]|nr:DUF4476 domain-containing protein [Bacteroidales bacterium]